MNVEAVRDSDSKVVDLPFEVINDILELACADCPSHLFRIHANRARFSLLVPYHDMYIQHTTKRIHDLADIIRSGYAFPSLPGIHRFALSFSLSMTGYYEYVMPAFHDGTLAYVLDQLFRQGLPYSTSAKAITGHTFSLHIRRWFRYELGAQSVYPADDSNNSLDIRKINRVLFDALKNLFLVPTLHCVTLESTINVPEDFFTGSRVHHLHLRNFGLDTHTVSQEDQGMSFDDSALLDGYGEIIEPDKTNVGIISPGNLTHVTRFFIQIDRFGTLTCLPKILVMMPTLQDLALRTRFRHANEQFSIPFSQLGTLRSISITSGSGSTTHFTTQSISHDIPSHIKELAVTFITSYAKMASRHIIEEVLEEMDLSTLDHHFAHPSFNAVESITVEVRLKVMTSSDLDDALKWEKDVGSQLQEMRHKCGSKLKVFTTTEAAEYVPL